MTLSNFKKVGIGGVLLLFSSYNSLAQSKYWTVFEKPVAKSTDTKFSDYKTYELNQDRLKRQLEHITFSKSGIIEIPTPDGDFDYFKVIRGGVVPKEMSKNHPELQSFTGVCTTDPSKSIVLDLTPRGFSATILSPYGHYLLDPHHAGEPDLVISYHKSAIDMHEFHEMMGKCESEDHVQNDEIEDQQPKKRYAQKSSGDKLRTYRMAITCSGEYSQWHIDRDGGGRETVLAAIVSTMNRVNATYKRDIGINLVLVPNEEDLIYLDPNTDPFIASCGNSLDEYQAALENLISRDDYDIGHHFCVGGGGIAGNGPCTSRRARGRSGSSFPTGNSFAGLVGHEIGHQFAASHTFSGTQSNCSSGNRSDNNAYEPGSGSTIMAYFGICGSDNLGGVDGDYYHVRSYQQMYNYITNGSGGNCPVVTNTGNTPPIATVEDGNWTIPKSTPFRINGLGADEDSDQQLTYCWEQYDLGTAGPPGNEFADGPLFRSYPPTTESFRIFPRLEDLVQNINNKGEALPATTREINFKLSVRDNFAEGGGYDYADLKINVTADAGPFLVTQPNTATTYTGGSDIIITWDVANTNQAPVSTSLVNILLSEDGGFTYPHTLAENVPNNGSATVRLTNIATTTARVKVEAVGNIFFDISNEDFMIDKADLPTFALNSTMQSSTACDAETVELKVAVSSVLGFTDPVAFTIQNPSSGLTIDLSKSSITPPDTLIISGTISASNGQKQTFDLEGIGGEFNEKKTLPFSIITFEKPDFGTLPNLTVCEEEPFTVNGILGAQWYDNPDLNTPISTEQNLSVAGISNDVTYYAFSSLSTQTQNVGPIDNTFGNGRIFDNNARGILVDVFTTTTWESATVYAEGAGERVFVVENGSGTLFSKTIDLVDGENRIELGFELPPGNGYLFRVSGNLVNLFRNNSNVNYPYTIDGIVSVTSSNVTDPNDPLDFYYYFYNMEFSTSKECRSNTVSFDVNVSKVNQPIITNNGTTLSTASGFDTYQWFLNASPINGATSNQHTPKENGDYTVEVSNQNDCSSTSEIEQVVSVGLADLNELGISITPNPATDFLSLDLGENKQVNFELLDMKGVAVLKKNSIPTFSKLDLSGIESGTYVLKIELDETVITTPIVKQ